MCWLLLLSKKWEIQLNKHFCLLFLAPFRDAYIGFYKCRQLNLKAAYLFLLHLKHNVVVVQLFITSIRLISCSFYFSCLFAGPGSHTLFFGPITSWNSAA